MKSIIKVQNLRKSYNNEEVLKGISLEITEKTFTVILGQSGSGKSTLLNIMSGLLKPSDGRVLLDNIDITTMNDRNFSEIKRRDIGYVFQQYLLLNNLTAEENIRIGAPDIKNALDIHYLAEILDISNLLKKFPAQLSGGEQQRVAIARAIIKKPKYLFCDEATGALDEANSKKVIKFIRTAKELFGTTVIFVTHNLSISDVADRVLTLKDGMLISDKINSNPIDVVDMIW